MPCPKNKSKRKTKLHHTPSVAPLLVPLSQEDIETENAKVKTEN